MATQAILVEDCSPMIEYTPLGAWQDSPANDTLAASYSGGSYHVTSVPGASATFQFRGTGFVITGGRRPGYGPFSITLDGQQLFSGNPPSDPPVKNNLASVSGLSNDNHTVVLTNTGGTPVDIDTITFQTPIGSAGSNLITTTIDDTDSSISYLPSANTWGLNSRPEFQDGTLHYSWDLDATASLNFSGNAVALYGTVSPDHADISITIDGKTLTTPSGSMSRVSAVRTQVMLYWANDLAGGEHTITIAKVQSLNTGPFVDIDSFVVFSAAQTPAVANTTLGVPSGTASPLPKETASHTGIIAGASVAGAMALLLIAIGLLLFFRRRRERRMSNMKASISPTTPTLPMQMESGMARPSTPNDGGLAFQIPPFTSFAPSRKSYSNKRSSNLSIAPSYYGDPSPVSEQMSERRASSGSSDQLILPVPRLGTPRTPKSLRTIPRAAVTDTTSSPSQSPRPQRPRRSPTLNLASLQQTTGWT